MYFRRLIIQEVFTIKLKMLLLLLTALLGNPLDENHVGPLIDTDAVAMPIVR
jgi:hypothetical protein